jgi:hypothetical protein
MNENRNGKDSLEEDPNYIAYKAQEEVLKKEHMGEWVAFADGKLAIIAKDREELFSEAEEKRITGFLYKEIVEVERVYHI